MDLSHTGNQLSWSSVFSFGYGEYVKTPPHGAYVWVLWRQYRGCVQAPGSANLSTKS